MSGREFDALFTTNKPIVFAFHGYPWLIHRLTYRRTNHANLHAVASSKGHDDDHSTWSCSTTLIASTSSWT